MLRILGSTWGALARCRASLYETGWLPHHDLERPVISVGALSVGGAGKTPSTALIAGLLAAAGLRPAIISRGYRRSGSAPLVVSRGDGHGPIVGVTEAGDEPFWLASVLPTVPVAVAARREEAATIVLAAADADVFVLDDAFQHLRVARDANLLVVNPERPFWDDAPMPSGRLRESPGAAARADGFLIVGADAGAAARLQRHFPERPRFELVRQRPSCWPIGEPIPEVLPAGKTDSAVAGGAGSGSADESNAGTEARTARLEGPAFAFAGIARPERFFEELEAAGVALQGRRPFPDHHEFSIKELGKIADEARECGAATVITTEKDAVRMRHHEALGLPLRVWGYRLQASEPERLVSWLKARTGLSSLPDAA